MFKNGWWGDASSIFPLDPSLHLNIHKKKRKKSTLAQTVETQQRLIQKLNRVLNFPLAAVSASIQIQNKFSVQGIRRIRFRFRANFFLRGEQIIFLRGIGRANELFCRFF